MAAPPRPLVVAVSDPDPDAAARLALALAEEPDVEVVLTSGTGEDRAATADVVVRDAERLAAVLAMARERVVAARVRALRERVRAALADGAVAAMEPSSSLSRPTPEPDAPAAEPAERIAVEARGKVHVVPVDELEYVLASGPYLELHAGGRVHLIREPMHALERRLDPARFMRVHRSVLVRLDRIETLLRGRGGDYEVQLRSGTRLRVSRSRREELERRIGLLRS